ncbi:MAG: hypothetical protein ACTSPY_13620 [Candidatus Helarchaeota archaeon]
MNLVQIIKSLITQLNIDKPSLKEVQNRIQIIKDRIDEDFEIIFKKSKNISVFHDIIKEIGYISSMIEMGLEGMFEYEHVLKETLIHLDNILNFYLEYNLD